MCSTFLYVVNLNISYHWETNRSNRKGLFKRTQWLWGEMKNKLGSFELRGLIIPSWEIKSGILRQSGRECSSVQLLGNWPFKLNALCIEGHEKIWRWLLTLIWDDWLKKSGAHCGELSSYYYPFDCVHICSLCPLIELWKHLSWSCRRFAASSHLISDFRKIFKVSRSLLQPGCSLNCTQQQGVHRERCTPQYLR